MAAATTLNKSSAVAEMGDRLARHGPKWVGELCPLGELGPPSNTMSSDTSVPSAWDLDPSSRLATRDIGRKLGVVPPFWEGRGEVRAGSPSNTMWPGPRPTSIPSGILIH